MKRREFCKTIGATAAAMLGAQFGAGAASADTSFKLRYVLSSAMYGKMPLDVILPEVHKTGARHIDIWRLPHGDQREQIDRLGVDAFAEMLLIHDVELAVSTCYPLGPFRLVEEMGFVKKLGGRIVLCGSTGPREPKGRAAKEGVRAFLEKMKPHVSKAEEHGLVIAVENHDKQLLYHPDALYYFAEMNNSKHLGLAFAPHHLHKWTSEVPKIIRALGKDNLPFFYGQEHSDGIRKKAPKAVEMQQMPGFGKLDYRPIIAALKDIDFDGFFEIFMHPVPRGIPILPTVEQVTDAINKSRAYLDACISESA